jgi:hypothetical protein
MSLIKKVDVPQYFAARRAMRLGTLRPSASGASAIEATAARVSAAKLKSDFSAKHPSSNR